MKIFLGEKILAHNQIILKILLYAIDCYYSNNIVEEGKIYYIPYFNIF